MSIINAINEVNIGKTAKSVFFIFFPPATDTASEEKKKV